jgi:outer membrane lipoprotein-sorting protein
MRARLLSVALLLLAGCSQQAGEPAHLLAEVKRRLAERDTRLTSYQLEGLTREDGAPPVGFTFAYRAPQKMRGTLAAPISRTFSWDGEHLFEQSDTDKRFTTFQNELSPERRAGLLTETFSPFTPEGFRAPLLPSNMSARRSKHALAAEAVELSAKVADPGAESLEVAYTLRWPSLDFLGKQTRLPDGTVMEVRVEQEHCEKAIELCVPQRLTRWVKGQKVGETTLSRVELNPALPNDTFTLAAPQGYEVQTKTLVDSPAK